MQTYEEILASMQERYKTLSGFDADSASDIGIRLKVLAQMVYQASRSTEELRRQVFVQTSTGDYLEMHAETRGLARKNALPAQGVLRFWRETPAPGDIIIAKGVLCATRPDPQVQFETAEAAVLPAGAQGIEVAAHAAEAGALGNVAPGAVCLMVTPAPGISGVSNTAGFAGGVDAESDDALRNRLLQSFSNISNGTNCAFYYDLAMQDEGVASANVLPRQRGRGTVDVVVSCHNRGDEAEIVAGLQEAMQARKEINVDVLVQGAQRDVINIEAEISVSDGYDAQVVLAACEERISGYISALGVGGALLLAQLGSALLGVDGVYNYRLNAPDDDVIPLSSHVVEAGAVQVKRMAVG